MDSNITYAMDNRSSVPKGGENHTVDVQASPVIAVIGMAASIWIIIANGFLVLCLIVIRHKKWKSFTRQIFGLALNDMILGLAYLEIALDLVFHFQMNYVSCAFSFYFFFVAQCASLFNILGICISRALSLVMERCVTAFRGVKYDVALIMAAWTASLCIGATPFIIWGNNSGTLPSCQIDFLFSEYLREAVTLFVGSYLLPMTFTNIVYTATCIKLLLIWQKLPQIDRMTDARTSSALVASAYMMHTKPRIRYQIKIVGTIGALLLAFNILTIPMVWMMCLDHKGIDRSRDIRVGSSIIFGLNSAINPFVYASRNKDLRNSIKYLLKCRRLH